MAKFNLKSWEKVIIVGAAAVFLLSLSLYVTDSSFISRFFFGISDHEPLTLVGKVFKKSGILRRQISGESDFKPIEENADLFNRDILVTSAEGETVLNFENGGSATLGPNTMVRLAFKTDFSIDNISRYQQLQLVSGQITGKAGESKLLIASKKKSLTIVPQTAQILKIQETLDKPIVSQSKPEPIPVSVPVPVAMPSVIPSIVPAEPSPIPSVSPTPIPSIAPPPPHKFTKAEADRIKIVSPIKDEKFSIQPFPKAVEKPVELHWKLIPANAQSVLIIYKINDQEKKEIQRRTITASRGKASATFVARSPGKYEWEFQGLSGEALSLPENTQSRFSVEPEFEGINLESPLVGGKSMVSNKLDGDLVNNFNITLRWDPYKDASKYKIWLGTNVTSKTILEKTLSSPEYLLNKNKIFAGQFYYKVTTILDNGFIAYSRPQLFTFNFLPPILVMPENNLVITPENLKTENNRLLITWQKTNFTQGYELEMALDPNFKTTYIKKKLKENYFILLHPKPGKYWWRVRSFSKDLSSPMGLGSTFTIAGSNGTATPDTAEAPPSSATPSEGAAPPPLAD